MATNCELHLVGQLGFEITDAQLKRAGLDYWPHLKWFQYKNYQDWWATVENPQRVFFTSAFAQKKYTDVQYQKGDWLVFGKETKGLDPVILQQHQDRSLQIPLLGPARGLNLATAVAVVAYEGVRQIGV